MSIQILPEQPSAASAIGRGLGAGISQQLPEEIKRYRLKSGLEGLASEAKGLASQGKSLSPVELIGKLSTIPGMDPGLMGALLPALQGELAFMQSQQQEKVTGAAPKELPGKSMVNITGGVSIDPGELLSLSPELIQSKARELSAKSRFLYPTVESAEKKILESQSIINNRVSQGISEYTKQLSSIANKTIDQVRGEIGPRLEQTMENQLKDKLLYSNKSSIDLAREQAKKTDETIKLLEKMRKFENPNISSQKGFTKNSVSSLRELKEQSKKLGIPEKDFVDTLQSQLGISQSAASYIYDPLKNSDVGKFLNTVGVGKIKPKRYSAEELASSLESKLTKNDAIGSLAFLVKKKGYDWDVISPLILRKLNETGKELTSDQRKDLADPNLVPKGISRLQDLWVMQGES